MFFVFVCLFLGSIESVHFRRNAMVWSENILGMVSIFENLLETHSMAQHMIYFNECPFECAPFSFILKVTFLGFRIPHEQC